MLKSKQHIITFFKKTEQQKQKKRSKKYKKSTKITMPFLAVRRLKKVLKPQKKMQFFDYIKNKKRMRKKKVYFYIHFKRKNIFFCINNNYNKVRKLITLGNLGYNKSKKRSFFSVIELSYLLRYFFIKATKTKKMICILIRGGKKKKKILLRKVLKKIYLRSVYLFRHIYALPHNGTRKKKRPRK